jgi:hypothetical protein
MISKDEKKYLWSKIEYKKKKISIEQKNELYKLLNDDCKVSKDDFIKILDSLEYSFKKRLKSGPDLKNDIFITIKNKLSKEWIGVKYSNLKSREKRNNKKQN